MSFFTVPFQSLTWKTILFNLIALPVAVFYFTLTMLGITLSIGLLVVGVGFLLGYGLLWLLHGMAPVEAWLVTNLLDVTVAASLLEPRGTFLERYRKMLTSPATWSRLGYIPLKLVTAIAGFVFAVTAIASIGLIASPLLYQQSWFDLSFGSSLVVDTFSEAVVTALVGLVLTWVMLFLSNLIGQMTAYLARAMVSDPTGVVL